jgi:hypothetical protein
VDTQTIDQEYEKLEGEFADILKTVQGLVDKMQAAEKAGDANATEWLADLKVVVQDISDEQTQAKVLLLAIHAFIRNIANAEPADGAQTTGSQSADDDDKPPLYAPGHEPQEEPQQQQQQGYGRRGYYGGGGMMGGYMGGGFARAMEMGAGMSIGASLVNSIFR